MKCGKCHKCLADVYLDQTVFGENLPATSAMMILCPVCGNKRCPKASDHGLACTGSNEPDQIGSVYSDVNFRTLEE